MSTWHFPAQGRPHGLAGPPTPGYRGTRLLPQLWMRSAWPPTSQPHLQPVHTPPPRGKDFLLSTSATLKRSFSSFNSMGFCLSSPNIPSKSSG